MSQILVSRKGIRDRDGSRKYNLETTR